MRKILVQAGCIVLVLLGGCVGSKPSAQEFFNRYLNLDPAPESVNDFQADSITTFPAFASHGYIKYKARPEYFDVLRHDTKFKEKSALNKPISQVACSDMPDDFSYWTNETINKADKVCYAGVFDFNKHLILYDPKTEQVWHFLQGIRD